MRTLPKRGCSTGGKYFLCISKKPATITDSAAERFPATEGKECKRKTLEKEPESSVVEHRISYTLTLGDVSAACFCALGILRCQLAVLYDCLALGLSSV